MSLILSVLTVNKIRKLKLTQQNFIHYLYPYTANIVSPGNVSAYCRFGNFRVTFILRFFDFRIIREVLNLRASIRVVGNFRGLKLGMLIVVSIKL